MSQLTVTAAYDQSPLRELEFTNEDDAFVALTRAHAAYQNRDEWLSPAVRIDILERLAAKIAECVEELAMQATREGGKPLTDSLVEIRRAISGIETAKESIGRLMGSEVPMNLNTGSLGRWAMTYREPKGVVLAISAFNHPFNLLIHQVVTAVAAGCPVIVKPAPATPLSCLSLVEMLHEAGLPPEWCQVILTENEVTQRLVSDPRVAFMTFIGSSKVGWTLRSLLPPGASCALEHGGVAPVIIDETADIEDAIPLLAKGAFYHAGQVCVSVQRIYAHSSIFAEVTERLVDAAQAQRVGDPTELETEVGPLIWPQEVERVHDWVHEAEKSGGRIRCGGKKLSQTMYAPTVIDNPAHDALVSQQEVFGPVVCIYSYDNLDDAIERANLEHAYFQASLFTNRLDRALDVGRRLHGMSVMVNDHTAFRVDWMPFGGHRHSGLNVGGIEHSMRDMTVERMIVFRKAPQ